MRSFTTILTLLICTAFLPAAPAVAGIFGNDAVVTIDGVRYTKADAKRWWGFWKEPEQPFPKTPDPYVEWLLLAREGKRMQLDEEPGFQRQTRIFLQARGLLMLKNEAVDSRISITDADIKEYYEKNLLPRWLVQNLQFPSEEAAQAAWQELDAGTLTVEELLARSPEQGGPLATRENWVRPVGMDPGWANIFRNVTPGKVVPPSEHEGGPSLFFLKSLKEGDEEDLAKYREDIDRALWKKKEDDLTRELLTELQGKYEVKIHQDLVDAIDISAPEDSFTETVVISTVNDDVTEREFMVVVNKLMETRPTAAHALTDEEEARKLKAETANNIIAQMVTNWESIDRHFEEREPFKWQYEFNYNHRLVIAVENRLFFPEAKVTEEEIKQNYDENPLLYTQPEKVRLFIIDDTQGPVGELWAEVMSGKDFRKALRELFEQAIYPMEAPANHLDPDIKKMVDKMTVGETSPIFKAQGSEVVVHLEERTPSTLLPLETVKEAVISRLKRQKVQKAADDYIEQIKSRSKVEVNQRQWEAVQKEVGGA